MIVKRVKCKNKTPKYNLKNNLVFCEDEFFHAVL
jgi:hypothetical protein